MIRRVRARILAVEHVADEPPGLVADELRRAGAEVEVVRVHRGDPVPRTSTGLDGVVVMGGPMGISDLRALAHLRDEVALLESALSRSVPTLGVCLGSQLLAHALGARVAAGPAPEIGWAPVDLAEAALEDDLLGGLPRSFRALHWHGDVFELPAGAVHLARSGATERQAFRSGRAWGLLFHLEASAAQVARMASAFGGELERAGVDAGALLADTGRHAAEAERLGRHVFGRFARLATGG